MEAQVTLEGCVGVNSSAASAVVEPASFGCGEELGRTTGKAAQVGLVGSAFGEMLSGAFRGFSEGGGGILADTSLVFREEVGRGGRFSAVFSSVAPALDNIGVVSLEVG